MKIAESGEETPAHDGFQHVVTALRDPGSDSDHRELYTGKLQEDQLDMIAAAPPFRNQPIIRSAGKDCLEGETPATPEMVGDFLPHREPAVGDGQAPGDLKSQQERAFTPPPREWIEKRALANSAGSSPKSINS